MYLRIDSPRRESKLQILTNGLDLTFALLPAAIELRRDFPVVVREQVPESEIFKRPLQLPNAKPAGKRREELHGFRRNRPPTRFVCVFGIAKHNDSFGQLDYGHAWIVDQRDQHMADIIRLALRLAG